ncbi:class I SAM-dependent methyltransferase [Sphingobium yanoikuyae]|uniref:Methyltransferase domain-containing protein n=1 Tax=Sphingobium yanoikuyae TaxID=13690 RepID=A0A9X7UBA8_SPHYA|nr:class I SAM-dependent methyltransferase [Sphingobium yanoikuyae]QNG46865.1 methyltransferase domain-containing protein [Sphingobium yanoikuyae]
MTDTDHNWCLWGERDPYYGVLTDKRFRNDSIQQYRDVFFAVGQTFVDHWLYKFEQRFGALSRNRALDFGCGVGRLTIPLSQQFASVTGVDISPAMLREAQVNSAGKAIEYRLSDDHVSQVDGTFDFVNCVIVLQHIPLERGMVILKGLLDRVGEGGGCLIQITTKRRYSWKRELDYRLRHDVPGGRFLINLLKRQSADTPMMQMNEYSLAEVLRLFHASGFLENLCCLHDQGGSESVTIMSRR